MFRFVLGAAAILFLAPTILFCLWPGVMRAWFEAGPEEIDAALPEARGLIAELKQLGFQALGIKAEKTPLRAKVRELSFVASDRRCYASIGGTRIRYRLYYYTPLPSGGLVLTSNGAFPKIKSERVLQTSHSKCGAQELLGRHQQALSSLGQRGEVVPTADARLEATYAYYGTSEIRSVLRRTGFMLLVWVFILAWLLLR